jgi:hypothetical protein
LRDKLAKMPDARDVLVWSNEFPDWKRAADVPEFRKQILLPPPLPDHVPSADGTREPSPIDFTKGIAGWLIFPVLGTILSPFFLAYSLFQIGTAIANMPTNVAPSLSMFVVVEFAFDLTMLLLWIFAMISAFRHKRWYPKLFVLLTAISLVGVIVDAYVASIFDIPFEPEDVKNITRPLLTLIVWGPYMFVSKRVRNTFVN